MEILRKKTISVVESQFRKGLKSAPTFWFYHFAERVFEGVEIRLIYVNLHVFSFFLTSEPMYSSDL